MTPARAKARLHVVLLCGGSGTRFWPLSRRRLPKQFLTLAGETTLIEATWRRVAPLASRARLWAVAPAPLARRVRDVLPRLRPDNLVVEPTPRDTAPAIALACMSILERDPAAVVAVLPTDHVIRDARAFRRAVRTAVREAEAGALVCLGVRPDRPATGFGYLRCVGPIASGGSVEVARFVEKPDARRAKAFVRSGRYLWNGGMFVWRASRFVEELRRTAPAVAAAVARVASGDRAAWRRAPRISVDYAVMEKAKGVRAVALDAGWDDIGSWHAAARLREAEPRRGDARHVLIDSPGTVVFDDLGTTAVIGVSDVVVVRTRDAVLVTARDRAEDVKTVVGALRGRRAERLL